DSHNIVPGLVPNPEKEFSPWAQRGAPPATGPIIIGARYNGPAPDTKLTRAAVVTFPTCDVSQEFGNGYVDVTITATDESGIRKISYILPGESSWRHSPLQPQHPTSASFSFTVRVTTSGILYATAMDNGGNLPG